MSRKENPKPDVVDQIALFDLTTPAEATTVDPVAATPSPEESEATNSATPAAAVLPAASGDADGHAIIVTAAGSYTPSGEKLTGPVDSVEKLDKLIRWATLTPLGAPAQVWVVGIDACEMFGWIIDPGDEDDVADDSDALGKMSVEKRTVITEALIEAFTSADDTHEMNLAIKGAFTSGEEGE